MIQINLIPDVKREFIHAQKMRRVAIAISIMVGLAAAAVVVLLGIILGGQQLLIAKSKSDIKQNLKTLQQVDNVDDIITLQNQLSHTTGIYDKHTMDSRLFDLLTVINPGATDNVQYTTIKLDPESSTLNIEGVASNGYAATEAFRKTILNTKIENVVDGQTTAVPLTDNVTISDTSYGEAADGSRVLRFTISFVYPEGLFDYRNKAPRYVSPTPNSNVTDSNTRVPESLFSQKAADPQEDK